MQRTFMIIAMLWLGINLGVAAHDRLHLFERKCLTDEFWAEGAHFADFNCDGEADIVYGPSVFEGPSFKERREYRPANQSFKRKLVGGAEQTVPGFEGALGTNNAYSDVFLTYTYDFNKDGWTDILTYGFPGKEAIWYENPRERAGHWQPHVILSILDNESPGFGDVTGDGKPEIVCCSEGYIGYAEADWTHPERPWKFRAVSPKSDYQRFTHGLGFGDVNGDGRVDIIEKGGWWEQPTSPTTDRPWVKNPYTFGEGGAQMFAYDVNGDGLNDIITSLQAHGYGVAWFEQLRENGRTTFRQHLIVNKEPGENPYGVKFSQPHALELVDMDGDGLKDIVTGKRFWAHGSAMDPEPNAPAVLYWFKLTRPAKGEARFIPYLVDNDSGVGTQVTPGHVMNKEFPDIIVGNKKGLFLFQHQTKQVEKAEWEMHQPKLISSQDPAVAK